MIELEPFYIHVNSPEESEIVQKLLFKCGYGWAGNLIPKIIQKDKSILTLDSYKEIRYCSKASSKLRDRRTIVLEVLITEIESKLTNINTKSFVD